MKVWVTEHAAERFAEKVRPGMETRAASVELARLLRLFGRRLEVLPPWLSRLELRDGGFLVEVSDGVVVIVKPASVAGRWPRASTVLTRATLGEANRAARSATRRARSARRAAAREHRRGLERRPRAGDWRDS